MDAAFHRVTQADLDSHLQPVLGEMIAQRLIDRKPGHCMKIGSLSTDLMRSLAESLAEQFRERAVVHVLGTAEQAKESPRYITSSKLIELRNPLSDGSLRPPLLVFVPDDLRVSAEDSFSGATFEQADLLGCYDELRKRLLAQVPASLRTHAESCGRFLKEREWPLADTPGLLRFLLSLKINGYDEEVLGAAICEFGLIPDFGLMEDPSAIHNRLAKNLEAAKNLLNSTKSVIGRVLDLEIANEGVVAPLIRFLSSTSLEDPVGWTSLIATERDHHGLSFNKWGEGADDPYACHILLEVVSIDVPEIAPEEQDARLSDLVGQRVLVIGGNGPQNLKVKFRCTPAPSSIPDLDHFRLQIISRESGPSSLLKKKKPWDGTRSEATQSFTRIRDADWDEGWHFVRVLPISADGDILPIINKAGEEIPVIGDDQSGEAPHESDLFYVIRSDDVIAEVPQRAVPKFPTVQHAILAKLYSALAAGGVADEPVPSLASWQTNDGGRDFSESAEFRFPGEGFVSIPLTRPLRQAQEAILASPRDVARWSLSLHHSKQAEISKTVNELPDSEALEAFLSARAKLFLRIREMCGDKRGLVEVARISLIEDEILACAETYSDLVALLLRRVESAAADETRKALETLNSVLAADTVKVRITDFRGGHRTAFLAAPTHPLRLLWLACWSKLARQWATRLEGRKADMAASVKQSLFESLALAHFPVCLTTPAGRLLHCNDNIHPLWSVYSPADEPDPRGLLAELCTALDLPEPALAGFSLNGEYLAGRIRRYVAQHPYVQTLTLNCFNIGRGKIVADALLALQRLPDTRSLRYEVRLFSENPEAPGIGDDLSELISPTSSQTAAEADAFATPTGDHLCPKLTFTQKAITEFQEKPSDFSAHITLLFDIFPSQTISALPPESEDETSPVHGLLQDFSIRYDELHDRAAWHRCPLHGEALPIPDAEEFPELLSRLACLMSNAAATLATGQAGTALRPVSSLVLGPKEKALLHQVHEASDWVFTIDRSMGVEFFDHKPGSGRQEYLIDHSPDFTANSGRRVVITSRSHTEVRRLFEAVLCEHGMEKQVLKAASLLSELRILSGRLALKLISASTHRAEALGLALGKLFLECQGALKHQAIVPLDSHLDLLRPTSLASGDLAGEISLKRTDLALFEFNWSRRLLTCRLVEVKCYQNAGGSLETLKALKLAISEQLDASEQAIRKSFNLEVSPEAERPDKVIRDRQFRSLLAFYIERAARLGLMTANAYVEARAFLNLMEQGYEIAFTKSAIIFDFEKNGRDECLEDNGIEYHRIGKDLITTLVDALPETEPGIETVAFGEATVANPSESPFRRTDTFEELRSHSFPQVTTAAFLPQERDHTVPARNLCRVTAEIFTETNPESPSELSQPAAEKVGLPIEAATQENTTLPHEPVPPSLLTEQPSVPNEVGSEPVTDTETRHPDVLLGSSSASPQFGHLAHVHGRSVALDMNQTQTISLFGVQGGGKSYTLGSIIEMATVPIPGINLLPQPLATVVFHYSQTQDYKPEFTSLNKPNDDSNSISVLMEKYGASPQALTDIVLLTPEAKMEARKAEYPDIEVKALKFSSSELQAGHWRFLMGAVGNQAAYIRRLNQIMRSIRENMTLETLRAAVENAGFSDSLRDLAMMRLDLASAYIDDTARVSDVIKPGRLVIVDLRDEFIEKDEALGLFVVLLQLFSDATDHGRFFNKLVVFDEAHKYIENPNLVEGLISVVREMRHKGTSVLVASQDPPSVPVALIELSTQIILHRFNSPAWLKHIQKANAALSGLQSDHLARLKPGEAFVWSAKTTDRSFSNEVVKVVCRPRITLHGGDTKTAVSPT
jgi:DNA phosphorothioation-dependent restriction protein DptH